MKKLVNGVVMDMTAEELTQQSIDADAALVTDAQIFVSQELARSDIEINKLSDGHSRTSGTLSAWRTYRNELRDYVQSGDIITAKPTAPDAV